MRSHAANAGANFTSRIFGPCGFVFERRDDGGVPKIGKKRCAAVLHHKHKIREDPRKPGGSNKV